MNYISTSIEGVYILEPRLFQDNRGYFFESFVAKSFQEEITPITFVQENESLSSYGVVRGLHFQLPPYTQSKLVRVVLGRVLDVAVDLRLGSPTYGQYVSVELSSDNHRQLFIPQGFAHGFSVLSEQAIFQYKCDNYYTPESEICLHCLDLDLAIDWQLPLKDMICSQKDLQGLSWANFQSPFTY